MALAAAVHAMLPALHPLHRRLPQVHLRAALVLAAAVHRVHPRLPAPAARAAAGEALV